jgi:hypothetical protein
VVLHGTLVVKDRPTAVSVPASVTRGGGTITVDGSLPTRFTALGMQPPSRMAGMARVRDPLVLRFHAVFRRE